MVLQANLPTNKLCSKFLQKLTGLEMLDHPVVGILPEKFGGVVWPTF